MNLLNQKNALMVASIVVILGGATYFYQKSVDQKDQASKSELYQIQKGLESELAALSEQEKTPGAKFDVDQKLSKTISDLKKLIDSEKINNHVKYEALVKLASLYFEHSEEASFANTVELLKKYSEIGKTSFQKSSILFLLGSAQERTRQFSEALESYQKALKLNDHGLKSEILLSLVRVSMKANDPVKAKNFSEQLTKEAPASKAAQEAQKLISKS